MAAAEGTRVGGPRRNSPAGGGAGFGLPALRPDNDYVLFDVGVSGELGNSKVTGFISVNAMASKNDGNYQAVTVGVRVPI